MSDVNQITIMGRLVREPSVYITGTTKCAMFTVAANRKWTDRNGSLQIETAFVGCKAFGNWATELQGRQKGSAILVIGRLRTESWEADGATQSQLCLICESVHALAFPERDTHPKPEVPQSEAPAPF